MNRSEAIRNDHFQDFNAFDPASDALNTVEGSDERNFGKFNDYMANPNKTSALFTRTYDRAPIEVIDYMKKYFVESQMAGSPLWQHVFSFKNEWLIEHKIMDEKSHRVDEHRLYEATRAAMGDLEKREGLRGEWTGAIHYNTKHIHVHVGYTEAVSSRPTIEVVNPADSRFMSLEKKGKFLKKNIRATRGRFVNELLDMSELLEVSAKNFQEIIDKSKSHPTFFQDETYHQMLMNLYNHLPSNRSRWKYGYAKGQKFIEPLFKIVDEFLTNEFKEEIEDLRKNLEPISQEYETAYGNPRDDPTYEENKIYGKNGLYYRVGNIILDQLREYDKEFRQQNKGANLTQKDIESLALEQQVVSSDLPQFDEGVPIPEELVEDYEQLYFDELAKSEPPIEEYPTDNFDPQQVMTEVDERLVSSVSFLEETLKNRSNNFSEADIREKMLEKFDEEKSQPLPVKRAFLVLGTDTEGKVVSKPISIMKAEGLQKEIILEQDQERGGSISYRLLNLSGKALENGKRNSLETEAIHNLNSFSATNKERILLANPSATFVYGAAQWKLKNRDIIPVEREKGIKVRAPTYDGTGQVTSFKEISLYDIMQTVPIKVVEKIRPVSQRVIHETKPTRQKGGNRNYQPEDLLKRDIANMKRIMRKTTQDYLNEQIYNEISREIR